MRIDSERCMGNGVCVDIAPAVFRIDDDGYAELIRETPDEHDNPDVAAQIVDAARLCPTNAIDIDDA